MINNLLQQLGFSEKEITVYLAILENGKITPSELSEITKIKRTTVYAVAKELIRRGVITEDQSSSTSYLLALPTDLSNSIQKEEIELQERKKITEEAIKGLKTIVKNNKYSIPKLVFISENELEMYLYKQSPIWSESISQRDGIWWGFQDPSFVQTYEKLVDWFWTEANSKDISLKLLTTQSDIEKEMEEKKYTKREMKFWKGGQDFTSTIWINGDYIVMINTSQRPHYLVEIHDAVMAHNLRELFKTIWVTV
jgi:DNA-binding MarR family transcriptional regulator